MSIELRLAIFGGVMALAGIAITILFPEKKWIGWLCLFAAAMLALWWLALETQGYQWKGLAITVVVGCLIGGGGAALIWYTATPKSEDGTSGDATQREFLFKYSAALNLEREKRIQKDLNAFAAYMTKIGLDLPIGNPTIEITTKNGSGASLQGDGPAYYDNVRIEAKRIDDPKAATEAYATWMVMRLIPMNYPKAPKDLKAITDSMMFEMSYRQAWNTFFHIYFSDSYWGTRRSETKTMPVANALWAIRERCKPEFADRLIAFTVRAYADDIAVNKARERYPKTPEEYFIDRLRTADNIVDSEASQWPTIEQTLKEFELLKPEQPKHSSQ